MHKYKAYLILILIMLLSFPLIGCDLLASRGTEQAVVTDDGELPVWLLLSYRTDNNSGTDKETAQAEEEKDETPAENAQQATATQPAPATPAPAAPAPSSQATNMFREAEDSFNKIMADMLYDSMTKSEREEWRKTFESANDDPDAPKWGDVPDWVKNVNQ